MSCASYAVGHRLHLIQAKLLAGSPWQWRHGRLRSNDGATLAVDYNGGAFGGDPGGSSVVLWHHAPLELAPGDPVRVHERWSGLAIGDVWHSVRRESGGLGPVPAPDDADTWPHEFVVVDLGAGVGRASPGG